MKNYNEILEWLDEYDGVKYPTGIYDELVVDGLEHPRKIELMGAWKTGSLRADTEGDEYTDRNNTSYTFTKRWREDTPVGYAIWLDVSANQDKFKALIPSTFPDDEPEACKMLRAKDGFGFIWTLFVFHCFHPTVYPLYDQHVYRAYKYMTTNREERPTLAANTWKEYTLYKDFFLNLLAELNVDFWVLDRALWTYGKYLKQEKQVIGEAAIREDILPQNIERLTMQDEDWNHAFTLGGKQKAFWWRLEDDGAITIKREMKNDKKPEFITRQDIEKVLDHVEKEKWYDLANNVQKLGNGTEKDGLGKFLFEDLGWRDTTHAQLSSHLGALFTITGVWNFNGKKRGMQFSGNDGKYVERIKSYLNQEVEG